jgi:dTDP-4-amino-4,6-dideoxygalactose transaminase
MPEVKGEIARFNMIGVTERDDVSIALYSPLSGFIGGKQRGGPVICELENTWAGTFGVKHAIACNSATSGLLAAAFAIDLRRGDSFAVSPYTMSATAAAPMFTGATPRFIDVEDETFCMNLTRNFLASADFEECKAVFVTNLFGHPSQAMTMKVDLPERVYLIEDNSQAPFAMEGGCYAGTFGDIGVFSLNVHKHIQCGEGGICVTDNDELAEKLRQFINHGEMAGGSIGLNLRLNEVSAAIALAQLQRGNEIVNERIEQAEAILEAIGDIPGIRKPVVRDRCKHVYYAIPFLLGSGRSNTHDHARTDLVGRLKAEGVPLSEGYVDPLYRLPAFSEFARKCQIVEDLHYHRLFLFENCAWDPTAEQIKQIGSAFRKVAEEMKL